MRTVAVAWLLVAAACAAPASSPPGAAVCGNGDCEPGENGSVCGSDCCDAATSCDATRGNGGAWFCRSMNGGAYAWVTQNDTVALCDDASASRRHDLGVRHARRLLLLAAGGLCRRPVPVIFGSRCARLPVLDDASVSRLCIQLLDRLRINIALCTEYDEVLFATKRAKEVIRRFPGAAGFRTGDALPDALRSAARAYLERRAEDAESTAPRRRAPVKLTSPDGALDVYVSATAVQALPPIATIVRLTDERRKLGEVLDLMRGRYELSARDLRLLRSVADQRSVKEIAAANGLTYGTTKVYLHDLYRRLDVHSRDGLLRLMDRVRRSR